MYMGRKWGQQQCAVFCCSGIKTQQSLMDCSPCRLRHAASDRQSRTDTSYFLKIRDNCTESTRRASAVVCIYLEAAIIFFLKKGITKKEQIWCNSSWSAPSAVGEVVWSIQTRGFNAKLKQQRHLRVIQTIAIQTSPLIFFGQKPSTKGVPKNKKNK